MNAASRVAASHGFEGIELVINGALGVDSTAYLVKMLEDPAAHGVDLARTLVITSSPGTSGRPPAPTPISVSPLSKPAEWSSERDVAATGCGDPGSEEVPHLDRGQDVGGVGALCGALAYQAGLLEAGQGEVEEAVGAVALSETVAEVGRHAVVEAGGRPAPWPWRM